MAQRKYITTMLLRFCIEMFRLALATGSMDMFIQTLDIYW